MGLLYICRSELNDMRNTAIIIFAFLTFISCETDLDVNAEYRETPIMFALIDQADTINYVRLQKAFANENSNALEIAKNFDSLYYDTTKVTFELMEVKKGGTNADNDTAYIRLVPEYNTNKVPGDFAAPGQYVYRLNYDFRDKRASDYTYTFLFTNKETQLVASAQTDIIECGFVRFPFRYECGDRGFVGELVRNLDEDIDPATMLPRSFFEFEGAENAAFFSAEAIIEYTEDYIVDDRDRDTFNIVTDLGKQALQLITLDLNEVTHPRRYGESETFPIGKTAVGSYLASSIPLDENDIVESRGLLSIQFRFYYYNTSYENYLEVNGNFNPLSQTKPLYTNVQNGLGLVAARSILETPKFRINSISNFNDPAYFAQWPELKFPFQE